MSIGTFFETYKLEAEALVLTVALGAAATCGAMVMHWRDAAQLSKVQAAWAQERAGLAQQVQQQQAKNFDLQRAAEKNYVVQEPIRDHYIVTTVKEIHDAAAPLAACPVPDAVRVRLNAAGDCAREDSPAACGAGKPVPDPSRPDLGSHRARPGGMGRGVGRHRRVRARQAPGADRRLAALTRVS